MRDDLIDELKHGPIRTGEDLGIDLFDIDGAASTMAEAAAELERMDKLIEDIQAREKSSDYRTAVGEIISERLRQMTAEGFGIAHDDQHTAGELARAAACYAISAHNKAAGHPNVVRSWPWEPEWWKPTTPRRDLVKAAALILAEIERIDRLEAKA